jgi:tRNA-Thr(GGU) m(6)t(6)A37 methyltransferase TsaA
MPSETFAIHAIGHIRSTLVDPAEAPRQGTEGAPDAWLDIDRRYADALQGITVGDELVALSWLQLADRVTLKVHPRNDPSRPLTGVFATRSQDRPNPLGLHRVRVHEVSGDRLRIGPIELVDGTPIVDLKAVLARANDA